MPKRKVFKSKSKSKRKTTKRSKKSRKQTRKHFRGGANANPIVVSNSNNDVKIVSNDANLVSRMISGTKYVGPTIAAKSRARMETDVIPVSTGIFDKRSVSSSLGNYGKQELSGRVYIIHAHGNMDQTESFRVPKNVQIASIANCGESYYIARGHTSDIFSQQEMKAICSNKYGNFKWANSGESMPNLKFTNHFINPDGPTFRSGIYKCYTDRVTNESKATKIADFEPSNNPFTDSKPEHKEYVHKASGSYINPLTYKVEPLTLIDVIKICDEDCGKKDYTLVIATCLAA